MYNKIVILQNHLLYILDSGEDVTKEEMLDIIDNQNFFQWLSKYDMKQKLEHPKLDLSLFDNNFQLFINKELDNQFGNFANYFGIENNGIILAIRWLNEIIFQLLDTKLDIGSL